MSPTVRMLILPAAFALLAMGASQAAQKTPNKADVPPPPGINDPGVAGNAPTPAAAQEAPAAAPAANDDPLAPLPKPDARLVRDKASRDKAAGDDRIASSEVVKRKQGDDTVEEYRQNGRVWMIKIVPIHGPIQTFVTNDGSGRLVRDPKEGPVSPVYYSLYEWK
ncbi:DUF2782 domain-containing protein [Dokdonella sp.]|uniref:DUF2782 domain-containing protein n=1 Tax=Dokdonella sp. TaxID=2291710 RepID=UPI003783F283